LREKFNGSSGLEKGGIAIVIEIKALEERRLKLYGS
jgi:hypothetical protein